jgi:hypothetical protein
MCLAPSQAVVRIRKHPLGQHQANGEAARDQGRPQPRCKYLMPTPRGPGLAGGSMPSYPREPLPQAAFQLFILTTVVLFRDRRRASAGVAQAAEAFFPAKTRRVPSAQRPLIEMPRKEGGLASRPLPISKKWF